MIFKKPQHQLNYIQRRPQDITIQELVAGELYLYQNGGIVVLVTLIDKLCDEEFVIFRLQGLFGEVEGLNFIAQIQRGHNMVGTMWEEDDLERYMSSYFDQP
ncbi:MAG: hypothetical protein RLP15_08285 [Cryomorphaceae bacterium]